MMTTPIVLSAFTALASVSHAQTQFCNALWYESSELANGLLNGPYAPWNVCVVGGTFSSMFTCGDDNRGYVTTYTTTDCTGSGVTVDVAGTQFPGYTGEVAVCDEINDCDFTCYAGYKASDGTTCSNSADGNYYYAPYFSGGCFETGNGQSKMYTTDDATGTVIARFWDNNDCSGDPFFNEPNDSCLFDDGECVVVEPTESPTNSPTGSPTPGPTSDPDGDDDDDDDDDADDDDDDDKNKWWGRGRPRHDDKKKW